MRVRELIELLAAFDPDAMVVVRGYEAGFNDPEPPRIQLIESDPPRGGGVYGIYGPFYDDDKPEPGAVPAVLIDR